MGSVKGFRYFAMYMRGREEMVLSVLNQPLVSFCVVFFFGEFEPNFNIK